MKELLKGIASFDHILTEEDVLRHNGVTADVAEDSVPPAAPDVDPVTEVPPPPSSEHVSDEPFTPSDQGVQLTDEQLAAKLEAENTKADLVAMAGAAGVDQSGNKSELSARLVSHYRAS
jgi:hypothetical protein